MSAGHGDLLAYIDGLREDLGRAEERISALERQTPATKRLQYEADLAAADLATSGYDREPPVGADRHGRNCDCPWCGTDEPTQDGGAS